MSTDRRLRRTLHILPYLGGIEDPVTSEPSDNQKTSPKAYRKYGDASSAANRLREIVEGVEKRHRRRSC